MIVIKYGGNALPDQNTSDPVLEAIADAFLDGEQIVLVHGGGPQIDAALAEKGIGKNKVAGYRVTDEEVFNVVQSVLSGQVLRSIVNYLIIALKTWPLSTDCTTLKTSSSVTR